jgi:hypothetical protein
MDDDLPGAEGIAGESVAGTAAEKAKAVSAAGKVASVPKDHAGGKASASVVGAGQPKGQQAAADHALGTEVSDASGGKANGQAVPEVALPSGEEFLNQSAEDAAKKEQEIIEEQRARVERSRAAMNEERIKFHEELRQILETHGKEAGEEIDALVQRSGRLLDQKTSVRAKGVWKQLGLSQLKKVNQLRAIDIPEANILNYISDSLYPRMRSPGGPRDSNELRVRAARYLLSYTLTGVQESPQLKPNPPNDLNVRGARGAVAK